ncbi:PIG-L family deacetylase [Brachybacterium squillarum]|uniref:PIG-L family deacetylase n=1 Tax=Brachybacterium squillarum TaxID=661979 RepID=UPI002222E083|nr:PIG-L family deacetylase [Brachybacterium squillarum]MCW1804180.1 PIG-L family deacetylase [Brachybacterium squillarum]
MTPSPQDPWALLDAARRVLVVHAHPDDETLSTGPLVADLTARGVHVELVTATRGEEGEVVPGAIAEDDDRPLDEVRAAEIDGATRALGLADRHLLGTAPALAAGAAPRRYRDSGMQWIREGLAGPSDTAGEDSLTRRPLETEVADLLALIASTGPDVIVSYDDEGTYGHPDHVRTHHLARAASAESSVPMLEISEHGAVRELPGTAAAVTAALRCYRTQLTVVSADDAGVLVRHVGGQDQLVPFAAGFRTAATDARS